MIADFMGLEIVTHGAALIPRPETALLAEVCLKNIPNAARILDIGTGSGNIAVALTKSDETCTIVALDASKEALAAARHNAERHGVAGRVEFIKANIFDNLSSLRGSAKGGDEAILFDAIVSNPPYIPTWEIETLPVDVKREPRMALDGGPDGLDFYRRITALAPGLMKNGATIVFETGYNQAYKVKALLEAQGFKGAKIYKDFSGINRVVKAVWTNS